MGLENGVTRGEVPYILSDWGVPIWPRVRASPTNYMYALMEIQDY